VEAQPLGSAIGGQTLKEGGDLQRTITHRTFRNRVEVGSIQPYAGVHQFGATITAKTPKGLRFKIGNQWIRKRQVTIPARPFLGLGTADREEIPAITVHWLRERTGA
jgi:phage gpG-like protein